MSNESNGSMYGSRIEWQNYSAARPINDRAEGTLERLLETDVRAAKQELRNVANEERMLAEQTIRDEHQAPDVTTIKVAADEAIIEFLDRIKELKRQADGLGVDLVLPAVERYLAEDDEDEDDYDSVESFTVHTSDRSLARKISEASRRIDLELRRLYDEIDQQALQAKRHILLASLTEEEQKVLNEVPRTETLKERLRAALPPAT